MELLRRRGFTLIEIMCIVAIIAIILAIAIPNYFKMSVVSKRTTCINNLVRITTSVTQWALDRNIPNGTNVTSQQEDDIYTNYFRGGKPKCPSGGEYVINSIGANPQVQCTDEAEGHKI